MPRKRLDMFPFGETCGHNQCLRRSITKKKENVLLELTWSVVGRSQKLRAVSTILAQRRWSEVAWSLGTRYELTDRGHGGIIILKGFNW